MSYIDNNLLPGERILFRTKKHLIIFFFPTVLLILSILASEYMKNNDILSVVAWVPPVILLLVWGHVGLDYWFSEYAVTNKRVMMREGFFIRHANEMRINTVSQVNVDQTLIGSMLNYGTVSINAFGAFDAYPLIANPFAFQKCVNQQVDKPTP
jgi:uncharacterized membrane protein YdbT with pleckstrin-like domain